MIVAVGDQGAYFERYVPVGFVRNDRGVLATRHEDVLPDLRIADFVAENRIGRILHIFQVSITLRMHCTLILVASELIRPTVQTDRFLIAR